MITTTTGIDEFSIVWQAVRFADEDTGVSYKYIAGKSPYESIVTFVRRYSNYSIIPKYYINGIDLAFWLNVNFYRRKFIDYPGQLLNALHLSFFGSSGYFPWFRLLVHQLMGHKIDSTTLASFGYDLSNDKVNWNEVVEKENSDIVLYGCSACGDRDCGYFSLQLEQIENKIIWHFGGSFRPLVFETSAYLTQFKSCVDLIADAEAYQKKILESFSMPIDQKRFNEQMFFYYYKNDFEPRTS